MIELILDKDGAHYSTNINNFESSVISVFDKAIASTQHVPQLEKVCTGVPAYYCEVDRFLVNLFPQPPLVEANEMSTYLFLVPYYYEW